MFIRGQLKSRARTGAVVGLGLAVLVLSRVEASWVVTNLHPTGSVESRAFGVDGTQQVGFATFGTVNRASLWSSTAASWVDLSLGGTKPSTAYGAANGVQVGEATETAIMGAAHWTGSAGSWINLTPPNATGYTSIYGTDGTAHVGVTFVSSLHRAALWSGTSDAWIDLSGGRYSDAFAVQGGQQGGSVNIGSLPHASIWSGSAESWVDLHPGPPYFRSSVRGVHSGKQVGTAVDTANLPHAMLWSGTAASHVKLTPIDAESSEAWAIAGDWQTGQATFRFSTHAGIWRGSANTWIDLHDSLGANFGSSVARAISIDEGVIRVAGYGFNSTTNRTEALLWTSTVPEPAGVVFLIAGAFGLAVRRRQSP